MIPATAERVSLNTGEQLNEKLSRRIHENVLHFAQAHPQRLESRLAELDREWDTDRLMETVSGAVVLVGLGLAAVNVWCLNLSVFAALCLLSHGLFGWDPLLLIYRHCGFRTSTEIDYERYALKAVRGDFQKLTGCITPGDRDAIARMEDEGGPCCDEPRVPDVADAHMVIEAVQAAKK